MSAKHTQKKLLDTPTTSPLLGWLNLWYCCAGSVAIRVLVCHACVCVPSTFGAGGGGFATPEIPPPLDPALYLVNTKFTVIFKAHVVSI